MNRDDYLAGWSRLHGGMEARDNRLVYVWLSVVYHLARPVAAAGLTPNAVTLFGVVLSGVVVVLAWLAGAWVAVAGVVVLISGALDNLDGAVAVLTAKSSRWGYVLDSLADRVADVLYLVALWLVGAPAWVCVAVGTLTLLQEYARARAAAGGMAEVGVVSVWERPSRVLVAGMFLLAAGIHPGWSVRLVTVGAWLALALAAVGCVQVGWVVRRRMMHADAQAESSSRVEGKGAAGPPPSRGADEAGHDLG